MKCMPLHVSVFTTFKSMLNFLKSVTRPNPQSLHITDLLQTQQEISFVFVYVQTLPVL